MTDEEAAGRAAAAKAEAWDIFMRVLRDAAEGKSGPVAQEFGRVFAKQAGEALAMAEAAVAGVTVSPPADLPSILSRLLAAGFDHAEVCLVATAAEPRPSYRFIGHFKGNGISYTQIAGEEDDLPRIERAVLEKLEALKVELEAEREREASAALARRLEQEAAAAERERVAKEKALLPGFYMDGDFHVIGDRKCRECFGGPTDCECGGLVHSQSVYGPSIVHICDRCGKPDDDDPPEPVQRRA